MLSECVACPECGEVFEDGDYLADHMTDSHQGFHWVLQGRPMDGDRQ